MISKKIKALKRRKIRVRRKKNKRMRIKALRISPLKTLSQKLLLIHHQSPILLHLMIKMTRHLNLKIKSQLKKMIRNQKRTKSQKNNRQTIKNKRKRARKKLIRRLTRKMRAKIRNHLQIKPKIQEIKNLQTLIAHQLRVKKEMKNKMKKIKIKKVIRRMPHQRARRLHQAALMPLYLLRSNQLNKRSLPRLPKKSQRKLVAMLLNHIRFMIMMQIIHTSTSHMNLDLLSTRRITRSHCRSQN